MATAGETLPTDRLLSDREFEELLQRTWELVQGKKDKVAQSFDPGSESTSWT